jgi:hypothetical protein
VTTFDVARLDDIPVAPLSVTPYVRHCFIPTNDDPNPLYVDPSRPTRWHTDAGTLYLAEDDVTVWAEHCRYSAAAIEAADPTGGVGLNRANFALYASRQLRPPVQPRAQFSVEVAFDRVADLTTDVARQVLEAAGIDPDADLLADDYGPCPDIAKAGSRLGWQAVRAASAARFGGVCVAVFRDAFPDRSTFDMVTSFGRPLVATAYVTRYKGAERPTWLGPPPTV